ncbi:hypothetical protein CBM2609_B30246 [Cupriavidus taiwanensis]|nr:hypothetical protein CBM2604_B40244 [Cupriavidus taiwanensis]SOZ32565.1 hypothetical protein CBM2609_B30246 [Cupriavidus taiwanensis]SOZ48161.1 hypothetical protein CBM2610_B30244 [Cupriavidus taiwanensis]
MLLLQLLTHDLRLTLHFFEHLLLLCLLRFHLLTLLKDRIALGCNDGVFHISLRTVYCVGHKARKIRHVMSADHLTHFRLRDSVTAGPSWFANK